MIACSRFYSFIDYLLSSFVMPDNTPGIRNSKVNMGTP